MRRGAADAVVLAFAFLFRLHLLHCHVVYIFDLRLRIFLVDEHLLLGGLLLLLDIDNLHRLATSAGALL